MYIELAVLALFIFCYSLVAGRLERAATSGPIVFVVALRLHKAYMAVATSLHSPAACSSASRQRKPPTSWC